MSHGASNLCAEHFYERRGGTAIWVHQHYEGRSPMCVGVFCPGSLNFEKWTLFVFYFLHISFFSSLRALRVK